MTRGRSVLVAGAVVAVSALTASAAAARTGLAPGQASSGTPASNGWVTNGTGNWVAGVGLVTTSAPDSSPPYDVTYGGASLSGSALPTTNPKKIFALSYDFNPAQGGASGGSPRMVVCFSDAPGCESNANLGPNSWAKGTWTTVDGFQSSDGLNNVWVSNGGTCGYVYNTTWGNIEACHAQSTKITDVLVVNDSGWEFPTSSEQVTLNNLDVNGVTATG